MDGSGGKLFRVTHISQSNSYFAVMLRKLLKIADYLHYIFVQYTNCLKIVYIYSTKLESDQ